MSDKLIERLRGDVANLRKAIWNASFGGAETTIRVKAPDLLITDLAEAADTLAAKDTALSEMRVELGRLRLALKPFAAYASLSSFDRLPADMPLTPGSGMAARQVTVGDFRRAACALSSQADGDAK